MAVNFEIATQRVPVGRSGYFDVRGLNSEDVVYLTTTYLEDIKAVVAKYATRGVVQKSAVADLVAEVAKDFPTMATEIISRCADATDPDSLTKFRNLSFVTQIKALKEIFILTAEDGGIELGKVAGFVASLLEANGLPPGPLTESLQTIIATYGKQSAT
jgi:hypothetical protein